LTYAALQHKFEAFDSSKCLNLSIVTTSSSEHPAHLSSANVAHSAAQVPAEHMANPALHAANADDPRSRLFAAATRIFADKGYANASTREICAAANVNVAAIHYYFGDKAGLYRAVFLSPVRELVNAGVDASREDMPLEHAMRGLYQIFIRLIMGKGEAEQLMRLHMREMLEPSGLIGDALPEVIAPHHHALVRVVCRALDLQQTDADVHRLVFSIMGLVNIYCTDQVILKHLAPEVLSGDEAFNTLVERLTSYACALVAFERQRRAVQSQSQ
jgi:TetR/AcrR family transcriptional regulator, regulator of cefoperazone and chloramphenicol sensitivity